MAKGTIHVSWGQAYMKKVKKDDFIKNHKHLADLGVDLSKVWDSHNPKST